MGGGDHGHGFDTRSVWSPAGGWFSDPRGWRRNTAVAFAVIGVLSAGVFNLSRKLEMRPILPVRPIPSQRWCDNFGEKAKLNDD